MKPLNYVPLTFRKSAASFFFLIILSTLLLVGCGFQKVSIPDKISQYFPEKENFSPLDLSQENPQLDQKEQAHFEEVADRVFEKIATSSLLNLHYTITQPEAMGLSRPKTPFGEVSLASLQEDTAFIKEALEELKGIPKKNLTAKSQLDYEILEYYLETEAEAEGLEGCTRLLMPTIGIQAQLPILIAEYSFYEKEDVEDYFQLLEGLDDYFGQILAFEQERAKEGLMVQDDALERIIDSCRPYLETGQDNVLTSTFAEKLEGLDALTAEEKNDYLARHQALLQSSFVPAYELLIQGLEQLKGTGTIQGGLCYYPKGKEYYRYLVYSSTATSCKSVDTLAKTILGQIQADITELSQILEEKPELLEQADGETTSMDDPAEILDYLKEAMEKEYPDPICQDYTIHYVPKALEESLSPAFFLTPPIDRAGTNPIYINQGSIRHSDSLFSTLAHEGYPGHLYQCAYFVAQNPDPIRHALSFGSYSEGWATYVEYESYHMAPGADPDLAKLLAKNSAVNLGIHAYLDIMVNDQGWMIPEISEFLEKLFAEPSPEYASALYEAMVDNPSNYLEYYGGYLEFSDMRRRAEHALKDKFSLKDFHQFLLDIGPAPFPVIRERLNGWIKTVSLSAAVPPSSPGCPRT